MTQTSAVGPKCASCGFPISAPAHIIWNGHHYHSDHVPRFAPTPLFDVVELQPDQDSPGLWIGFKTAADRERAMQWFRVDP